jgi:hypothetical protein
MIDTVEPSKRLVVYDKNDDQKWVSLDISNADVWPLEREGSHWDGIGGYFRRWNHRTLYRLANRTWLLVEQTEHADADGGLGDPTYQVLTDAEAAEQLLRSGHTPPDDVIHFASDKLTLPRPQPRPEQGAEAAEQEVQATSAFILGEMGSSRPSSDLATETGRADNAEASRMSVGEANTKARKLVKQYRRAFFAMSKNQQAELIGCHRRTWEKTQLYQSAVTKGLIAPPKPRVPKTITFTSELEAATGEGERDEIQKQAADEETLRRLMEEQAADYEPSSLKDDPPGRQRKIHSRKRL